MGFRPGLDFLYCSMLFLPCFNRVRRLSTDKACFFLGLLYCSLGPRSMPQSTAIYLFLLPVADLSPLLSPVCYTSRARVAVQHNSFSNFNPPPWILRLPLQNRHRLKKAAAASFASFGLLSSNPRLRPTRIATQPYLFY